MTPAALLEDVCFALAEVAELAFAHAAVGSGVRGDSSESALAHGSDPEDELLRPSETVRVLLVDHVLPLVGRAYNLDVDDDPVPSASASASAEEEEDDAEGNVGGAEDVEVGVHAAVPHRVFAPPPMPVAAHSATLATPAPRNGAASRSAALAEVRAESAAGVLAGAAASDLVGNGGAVQVIHHHHHYYAGEPSHGGEAVAVSGAGGAPYERTAAFASSSSRAAPLDGGR